MTGLSSEDLALLTPAERAKVPNSFGGTLDGTECDLVDAYREIARLRRELAEERERGAKLVEEECLATLLRYGPSMQRADMMGSLRALAARIRAGGAA